MYDMGLTLTEEPFKKLVNQGMIQGVSEKTYFVKDVQNEIYFKNEAGQWEATELYRPAQVFISSDLISDYPSKNTSGNEDLDGLSEMTVQIDLSKNMVLLQVVISTWTALKNSHNGDQNLQMLSL